MRPPPGLTVQPDGHSVDESGELRGALSRVFAFETALGHAIGDPIGQQALGFVSDVACYSGQLRIDRRLVPKRDPYAPSNVRLLQLAQQGANDGTQPLDGLGNLGRRLSHAGEKIVGHQAEGCGQKLLFRSEMMQQRARTDTHFGRHVTNRSVGVAAFGDELGTSFSRLEFADVVVEAKGGARGLTGKHLALHHASLSPASFESCVLRRRCSGARAAWGRGTAASSALVYSL